MGTVVIKTGFWLHLLVTSVDDYSVHGACQAGNWTSCACCFRFVGVRVEPYFPEQGFKKN